MNVMDISEELLYRLGRDSSYCSSAWMQKELWPASQPPCADRPQNFVSSFSLKLLLILWVSVFGKKVFGGRETAVSCVCYV